MQIFLQSRGTDWPALFCASKPACSCIYRDGRCLTDSGMTQPAPVFFYIFSAAVRLRYSWQVHSYYGEKEDGLSYVVYCVRHQLFSDFCFIENISEFRYITTSFSGIKQLQNALCPFLKYFVFRSLGYTRNAHHLILIRHTEFNRIC